MPIPSKPFLPLLKISSDWLGSTTASMGTYPPVNVFQQGDDLVAIVNCLE
jgi:hypothetical protein